MSKGNDAKSVKLGMSFGTARARLDRDILFKLAVDLGHKCLRCGEDLRREDLSVDHKTPWLNAPDPKKAFFDLQNIGFSHLHCNQKEMISRVKIYASKADCQRARRAQNNQWHEENKDWYNPLRNTRRRKINRV